DIIAKALNDKKNYSFLCRLLLKKNEVITVYIQAKFGFKEKKTPQILYGIVQDVTEMKKMQNELCISEMIGQEKERSRISKDLHDGVGQMLLATNLNLISITNAAKKKDEALAKRLEETISTMQTIIQEVRDISHNMAPCVLKNRGLPFSIRTICETTFKKHHISFSFHSNLKKHLPELQQTVLFRIFQEISTNIIKHAQCSKVDISLFKKRNKVQLIVEDNGKGIEINLEKHKKDGIGLEGIKNRVELLNGDFKINSQKNKGARIEISIPC
ncbi:MAG: sensor histidine kinase, partial [Bacteroidia bacterium]